MAEAFDRVHTVTDYWDGPREGVADYRKEPHIYRSVWRRAHGDWDVDRYFLCAITPEAAALAFEDWAIWQRFTSHYQGQQAPAPSSLADWGALPEDLSRHRELRELLAPVLALDQTSCVIARGEFRSVGPPREPGFVIPSFEVRWTLSASELDDELLPSPAA